MTDDATDEGDDGALPADGLSSPPSSDPGSGVPTVSCSRCDGEWRLDYELEEMAVGNQAVEQFALDHQRHTGHYPDDVTPWRAVCRRCPETVDRLREDAARRWAAVHSRHTRHAVELRHDSLPEPELVDRDQE